MNDYGPADQPLDPAFPARPVWQDSPGRMNNLYARCRIDRRFVQQRPAGYGWLLWVSWPLTAPWASQKGANWEPEWSLSLTARLVAELIKCNTEHKDKQSYGLSVAQVLGADSMMLLFYLSKPEGYRQRILSALDHNAPVGLDYGISRDKDWLRFRHLQGV